MNHNEIIHSSMNIKHGYTHSGKFHADDVFSSALLRMVFPGIQIHRVVDTLEDMDGVVFDIGGGRYDHHAITDPVRENGIKYAAFGLLWRDLGADILGEVEAANFDQAFVQVIDDRDNNGTPCQIAEIISTFNPVWDAMQDEDAAFEEAVAFASIILQKKFAIIRSQLRAEAVVQAAIEQHKGHVLVLEHFMPWKKVVQRYEKVLQIEDEIRYVVYPSTRGGMTIMAAGHFEGKTRVLPEEWWGMREAQLQEVTGIPGVNFCHSSGFMMVVEDMKSVYEVCALADSKEAARG